MSKPFILRRQMGMTAPITPTAAPIPFHTLAVGDRFIGAETIYKEVFIKTDLYEAMPEAGVNTVTFTEPADFLCIPVTGAHAKPLGPGDVATFNFLATGVRFRIREETRWSRFSMRKVADGYAHDLTPGNLRLVAIPPNTVCMIMADIPRDGD